MTLAELKDSLSKSKPPSGLAPALSALWWAGKNEWKKAHRIVMDESGKDCAWVHAYLHRPVVWSAIAQALLEGR
jgi:hypothetical protein